MTMRVMLHGVEHLPQRGGCILACTHISHLDPVCLSTLLPRKIHWMARIEFYRRAPVAALLHMMKTIPLNRFGVPLRAIKTSIAMARDGDVVGIFPEGEIKRGAESVLRGGPIKRGLCLIAQHSGCPIVPCVIVGTHELLRVGPWLPFRRGRLWIICGEPIAPVVGADGKRKAREQMARQVQTAMIALFEELKRRNEIDDTVAP